MFRTHTCGELNLDKQGHQVTLAGWVQKSRDLGGMTFIDLRDRYGITQLAFNMDVNEQLCIEARKLGREFVIQIEGKVKERESKNKNIPTGDIEIEVSKLNVLNISKTPPFTIENETDGGEDLRMQYRYLDLRRNPLRKNLELRHRVSIETRKYLDSIGFFEIETPYLIKSTPEGARDFVVPSRMHPGEFYALPQSPQTFKQLLMVSGYDRYYQIVKCFRDEDLRADRQPEFTQIDCEMAFVEQDDILATFEDLTKHLLATVKGVQLPEFPRMTYADAMKFYGNDKPDTRFDMKIHDLKFSSQQKLRNVKLFEEHIDSIDMVSGKGFKVFDDSNYVGGILLEVSKIDSNGEAQFSRKQFDSWVNLVKSPQIGASGLIYVRWNPDGTIKSSIDKFYSSGELQNWLEYFNASPGDIIFIMAGEEKNTRTALGRFRLALGKQYNLMDPNVFKPLWVVDFPLLEWDEDTQRYHAMHHPFTSPKPEHLEKLETDPGSVNANAYDLVINGVEIGGGSIRIHDRGIQERMFKLLGFTDEEARSQFGFLMNAFEYGAPPHGGVAFGFDRLCSLMGGSDSIRDFIAFPKNNAGRDVMIDSPSPIDKVQLEELCIDINTKSLEV